MGPKKHEKQVSKWQPLPDNATTLQSTTVFGLDDQTIRLEDVPRNELDNISKFIDQSNKTLRVENMIIERYLSRMDPTALTKIDQVLEAAAVALQKVEKAQASSLTLPTHSSAMLTRDDDMLISRRSSMANKSFIHTAAGAKMTMMMLADKGPRVQPAHKIEIVNREIEELRSYLEQFRAQNKKENYIYKCRHEELSSRLAEIKESREYFEEKVLAEGTDPLTGKLPGEKFTRYLEMKAVGEEKEIDKMRIKTSSTLNQLRRLKQQLAQKKELGEILHAIDFEHLKIENNECQERLDQRIQHLIEMKKIHGRCGTQLNFNLKKLQEQVSQLNNLKKNIDIKEKLIHQLQKDESKADKEVAEAHAKVLKIKRLMNTYSVPDAFEYIKLRGDIFVMEKDIKKYDRKLKLKDLAIAGQAQKLRAKMEPSMQMVRTRSSKKFH